MGRWSAHRVSPVNEGLATFRVAGDLGGIADVQLNFGYVLLNVVRDIEQAVAHLEVGRTAFEAVGNRRGTMATLGSLGFAYGRCDDPRVLPTMRNALTLARQLDVKTGCLYGILLFATYMIHDEEPEQGVRLFGAAEACHIDMGLQPVTDFDVPIAMDCAREQRGETQFIAIWKAGQNLSLEQAVAEVLDGHGTLQVAVAM